MNAEDLHAEDLEYHRELAAEGELACEGSGPDIRVTINNSNFQCVFVDGQLIMSDFDLAPSDVLAAVSHHLGLEWTVAYGRGESPF